MDTPFKPRPEDRPFLRRLGWLVLVGAVLLIVWRAADLLLLAFGSVLGAVILRSAGRMMQRAGIRNATLAFWLGTLLAFGLFGAIGYLLAVQFGAELGQMLGNLPGTLAAIERALSGSPVGRSVVEAAKAAAGHSTIAEGLSSLAAGGGQFLVNLLIVIVGAVFIAVDPGPYRRAVVLLTPPPARATMKRALHEISLAMRLWLRAKLISMGIMTVLIGGSLWLAGVDSWAALGLLGGLSEFVPYVGPAVAMLPSIGIAATMGGAVLWRTIVAYVAVRLIEAWLLTPVINRRVVRISPALTLLTILGAGAVFGLYGVFFAGALLVVTFVAVREFYLRDTLGEDIDGVPREATEEPR